MKSGYVWSVIMSLCQGSNRQCSTRIYVIRAYCIRLSDSMFSTYVLGFLIHIIRQMMNINTGSKAAIIVPLTRSFKLHQTPDRISKTKTITNRITKSTTITIFTTRCINYTILDQDSMPSSTRCCYPYCCYQYWQHWL